MQKQGQRVPHIRTVLTRCILCGAFIALIFWAQAATSTTPSTSAQNATIPSLDHAIFLPITTNQVVAAPGIASPLPSNNGIANPCGEGLFLDLRAGVCRALDKPEYGFDMDRFASQLDATNVIQADCTEDGMEDALDAAQGGGIVQLPACTFSIERTKLPSNVLLQGAGMGQTVIHGAVCPEADSSESAVRVMHIQASENVVLRDMTLDAQGRRCVMIHVENSDNILIERVDVTNNAQGAIRFTPGVRNITIRYSKASNSGEFHGIGSKDCSTHSDGAECPPAEWSSSYAIYSNELFGNNEHGLNLHAVHGEVAGNLSHTNGYGGKMQDGQCVWVHHNAFRNNDEWGLWISPTLAIPERISHGLYFYQNEFSGIGAGSWAWGISAGADSVSHPPSALTDIYLMNNTYGARVKNDTGVPLNICSDTTESNIEIDNAQLGDAAVCTLSDYPSLGGSGAVVPSCSVPGLDE